MKSCIENINVGDTIYICDTNESRLITKVDSCSVWSEHGFIDKAFLGRLDRNGKRFLRRVVKKKE